jgi:o-succinylbenzoate synthase
MRRAKWIKHTLKFKRPSGTSRGVLTEKPAWFILKEENGSRGVGECSLLPGLSYDDRPEFEAQLSRVLKNWEKGEETDLNEWPSIRFAMETSERSLRATEPFELFPSPFKRGKQGIEINGLVWMGSQAEMNERIKEKIAAGFDCVKLKIGAIDFEEEIQLLKGIRKEFGPGEIEIRVDANGAFDPQSAVEKLNRLADLKIHSIEQPLKPGQWEAMARLCESTPLDIALDEELIPIRAPRDMEAMLKMIRPQAIVIKPGLVGGLSATQDWISSAQRTGSYFWLTSALESNVGLNAIAQFTATLSAEIPQGLGTGGLYTNNITSPLYIEGKYLHYDPEASWGFPYRI